MAVDIKYNGEVIATAESGQTAALKCSGYRMGGDVEVTAYGGDINADELNEVVEAAVSDALQEAKDSGMFDGKDGADGKDGTNGKDGADGTPGPKGEHGSGGKPVTDYGAKGDGTTDDTAAFQAALAANRIVFVPEGTYKLSGTLVIRPNCRLELTQATHLDFKQTSGNCIEVYSSAAINGNHAVIEVPYGFTGHVIDVLTSRDSNRDTPPFAHFDPMWKRARYIYDVCIVMHENNGLNYSDDGTCSGVGIYMSCISTNTEVGFIWGAMLQGIRIAGAFTYGIQVINYDDPNDGAEDDAWNHDMRIEAVIQGCETGVSMTNCNGAHLAVSVQPSTADNGAAYAKYGVYLNDCRFVDMSSSFIWDWHVARTDSKEYTHIAMYGNCRGLVLSEPRYYEESADVRDVIYTDTPSNLEKMTILQEPITRWFKQKDGVPYYSDGFGEKQLATKDELDSFFDADIVKGFTDVLANATDENGNIYNGVGYEDNTGYYDSAWGNYKVGTYHFHTGFIPVKAGDTIYGKGLSFNKAYDGNCRINFYNSSRKLVTATANEDSISAHLLITEGVNNYYTMYEGDEDGFKLTVRAKDKAGWTINTEVAYIRFQMLARSVGEMPMMSVNEEIKYSAEGMLADGIQVKGDSIIMSSASGKSFKLIVDESGALSTEAI